MPYDKTKQAKHVDTIQLLTIIEWLRVVKQLDVHIDDLVEFYSPEFPPKVVRAKLTNLLDKALIDGCVCGCRGGFSLTHHGVNLLKEELEKMDSQE